MGINTVPQTASNLPDNAKSTIVGGYFSTGTYTATGNYSAGLYILKGYKTNDLDSRVTFTFPANGLSVTTDPTQEKNIYLSTSESTIYVTPFGTGVSSLSYLKSVNPGGYATSTYYTFYSGGYYYLAADRNSKNILVTSDSSYGNINASTDGGITWRTVNTNSSINYSASDSLSIAYEATKTNKYVVTYRNTATTLTKYRYSTDGLTWSAEANWPPGSLYTSKSLKSLNSDYYCAAEGEAGVYKSTNGTNWSVFASLPGTTAAYDIEYIGTQYVVTGSTSSTTTSHFYYSTNGTTWTAAVTPYSTNSTFYKVLNSNSKLIAVDNYGSITSSTDGITWIPQSGQPYNSFSPNSGSYTALNTNHIFKYANGNFILGYNTANIVFSPDTNTTRGLTQSRTTGITSNLAAQAYDFAYGAGVYVAVGAGATNRVATSTDLVTWTGRGSTNIPATPYCVIFGTVFVAGGASGAISTSTDGITWTSRTSNFGTDSIHALAYESSLTNKYVAVGSTGKISYSTDAITWTAATAVTGTVMDVTYAGGKYVAVGYSGSTGYVHTSTNGSTWSSATPANFGAAGRIIYFNSTYIAAQPYGTLQTAGGTNFSHDRVWTSTDATTWTTRQHTYTIANNSTQGSVAGLAAGTYYAYILTNCGLMYKSSDGITWVPMPTSSSQYWYHYSTDGTNLLTYGYFGNGGGNQGTNNYVSVSANDGATWTNTLGPSGYQSYFSPIFYNGSNYAGSFGALWLGSSLSTWRGYTEGIQYGRQNTVAVSADNQTIVVFGGVGADNSSTYSQRFVVSTNAGSTWQQANSPSVSSQYGIGSLIAGRSNYMYVPNQYAASSNVYVGYSTNGLTWSTSGTLFTAGTNKTYWMTSGTYSPITNTYVFAGSYNLSTTYTPMFFSVDGSSFTLNAMYEAPSGYTSASSNVSVVAYGNNMFVAAYNSSPTSSTLYVYASDKNAMNWNQRLIGSPAVSTGITGIAYGAGLWVVALSANISTGGSTYFTSTDTVTWTGRTGVSLASAYAGSLSYDNGFFFMTASDNSYYLSSDGLTWSTYTASAVTSERMWGAQTGLGKLIIAAGPGTTLYTQTLSSQGASAYLYDTNSTIY